MFPVFHLAWSTWPATKTFVAGWRNAARWLVDLLGHEQICCATSCEFDEKRATRPKFVAQSRPALYFSQQLFSTRNKCFCFATSWSRKVKNGKHRQKLATKQCCATSWGFFYLVFRRLNAPTFRQFCTLKKAALPRNVCALRLSIQPQYYNFRFCNDQIRCAGFLSLTLEKKWSSWFLQVYGSRRRRGQNSQTGKKMNETNIPQYEPNKLV